MTLKARYQIMRRKKKITDLSSPTDKTNVKCVKFLVVDTQIIEDQEFTAIIGGLLTVQIVQTDITIEETDAITNAANNHMRHGKGVAGAISKAGGP